MPTPNMHEITTAYLDNAGYQNLEEATKYQVAIRQLIVRRPKETIIDGQKIQFDMTMLRDELQRANLFIDAEKAKVDAANGSSGFSRTYDLSDIRN